MTESADLFRDAWLELRDDNGPLADLRRMSLEAMAQGIPDLDAALADLKSPQQAELDLHLTGGDVTGHEATADTFGRFVTRVAAAVKEIAKSLGGRQRYAANLRVLAPSQGSVRVILRAPDVRGSQGNLPGVREPDTIDSLAVKRLAAVLAQADAEEVDDSPLVASVQSLGGQARLALRQVARSVTVQGWDVEGVLRQQGETPSPVRVSPRSALRLIDAITNERTPPQTVTLSGIIDGQRRSLSAMWFLPDGGRPFEAAVNEPELLDEVAALAADQDQRVAATFTMYESFASPDSDYARRSYVLTAIVPIPLTAPDPQLPIK